MLRIDRSFSGLSVLFTVYGTKVSGDPAGTDGAGTEGVRPVVELAEQQKRRVVRHAAEPLPGDDGAWKLTVPLAKLLDTSRDQTWTLRLPRGPRGGRPLDLGRREHDLRAPRQVLTPPKFTVRAEDGTFVQIKPQYTRRGALQLVCTPRTPSSG